MTDLADILALVVTARSAGDWPGVLNGYNNVIYHATDAALVVDAYVSKAAVLAVEMRLSDKALEHLARATQFAGDDGARAAALKASDALRGTSPAQAEWLAAWGLGG